ncbi:protein of unknown function [Burkholderia multivorans]
MTNDQRTGDLNSAVCGVSEEAGSHGAYGRAGPLAIRAVRTIAFRLHGSSWMSSSMRG